MRWKPRQSSPVRLSPHKMGNKPPSNPTPYPYPLWEGVVGVAIQPDAIPCREARVRAQKKSAAVSERASGLRRAGFPGKNLSVRLRRPRRRHRSGHDRQVGRRARVRGLDRLRRLRRPRASRRRIWRSPWPSRRSCARRSCRPCRPPACARRFPKVLDGLACGDQRLQRAESSLESPPNGSSRSTSENQNAARIRNPMTCPLIPLSSAGGLFGQVPSLTGGAWQRRTKTGFRPKDGFSERRIKFEMSNLMAFKAISNDRGKV